MKNPGNHKEIRVLITGGPTRAYLDRVRFLSNVSTGKTAYAICNEFLRQKISVAAVMGPTAVDFSNLPLKILKRVETNDQMRSAIFQLCKTWKPDVIVFAAAVLDFEPVQKGRGKITSQRPWTLRLKPTPKIMDGVSKRWPNIFRIGFKLQWERTSDPRKFALRLAKSRDLDAVVVNYLSEMKESKHPAWTSDRLGRVVATRGNGGLARELVRVVRRSLSKPTS